MAPREILKGLRPEPVLQVGAQHAFERRLEIVEGNALENLPPDRLQAEIPRVRALEFLAAGRSLAQAALKFCLTPEAVSCVIPGVMSVPQLEENVAAAFVPDLTPDELKRIETV